MGRKRKGNMKQQLAREGKKYKTCNGCVALQDEQGYGLACGYKGYNCSRGGVPLAPCPKPRTYKLWVEQSLSLDRTS